MLRRLMVGAALVTGLLVMAAFAAVVFRIALAEAVLSSQLASLGVPAARLTVASLDLRRLTVTDIAVGNAAELRVDSISLTYRPSQLLSGRLEQAVVDGVHLRLDLTGTGPPLGSLQGLLEGGTAKDDGAAGVGGIPHTVILSRARIETAMPSGSMTAAVSGQWYPLAGMATLALTDVTLPHVALETSRLDVEATPDRIVLMGQVRGEEGAVDLDLRATVESWRGEPTLALALESSVDAAAWRIPPVPGVAAGRGTLSAQLNGRLQALQLLRAKATALPWLLGGDLRGRLQASADGGVWRDRAQGISGSLDLTVAVADGGLDIAVADGARVGADRISPALLDAADVAATVPGLGGGAVTAIVAPGTIPVLRLRPTSDGVELAVTGNAEVAGAGSMLTLGVDGTLTLDERLAVKRMSFPRAAVGLRDLTLAGGHRLRQLRLTGVFDGQPQDLKGTWDLSAESAATRISDLAIGAATLAFVGDTRWAEGRLEMRQRGEGTVSIASLAQGTQARTARPFAIRLAEGAAALDFTPDGVALTHAVSLRPEPVNIDLMRPDASPLLLRATLGTIRLEGDLKPDLPYRGQLILGASRLAVPDQALAAEAITASLAFPAATGESLAQFTVGRIVHTATPSHFVPFRVDGEIARQKDAYLLTATGIGAGGDLRLTARARHRIADDRGTLRLDVSEIAFRKNALQPVQLSPLLRDLSGAAGRIGAGAEFAWGPDILQSKGTLTLTEVAFAAKDVTVDGLDSRITFDGLLPPATPPGQTITVRQIDPAVPLDDVAIRFQAESAWPPRLRVAEAAARFAGGRLAVDPTVFDLSRSSHDLSVAVDGVDLALLLGLLKVEDVSATGRLGGTIPVTVADGTAVVTNGRLAADGPGVLRVRSAAARSALGGTGESVALMLSALEDFRYDSLTATVNIGTDGNVAVMLRMRGHNPAVLDGYPFAFNIGLDGNLTELLLALRQGAQLSTDLVRPQLR